MSGLVDESIYDDAMELVCRAIKEGMEAGAIQFIDFGEDLNVELGLRERICEVVGGRGEDTCSMDGCGVLGPACKGGGDDTMQYEKKLRWLQLLRDYDAKVSSSWSVDPTR